MQQRLPKGGMMQQYFFKEAVRKKAERPLFQKNPFYVKKAANRCSDKIR